MPPGEYKNLSELVVEFGVAVLFFLVVSMFTGCAHSAPEPEWEPHIYLKDVDSSDCKFVDGFMDTVPCRSERMLNYILIPASDLEAVQSKMHRCVRWQ